MCAALGGTFQKCVPTPTAHLPLLFLPHSGKNSTLFIIYYLFFIICLLFTPRFNIPPNQNRRSPHVPYRKIQKT